jgi:hypothetical protein
MRLGLVLLAIQLSGVVVCCVLGWVNSMRGHKRLAMLCGMTAMVWAILAVFTNVVLKPLSMVMP